MASGRVTSPCAAFSSTFCFGPVNHFRALVNHHSAANPSTTMTAKIV